MHRRQLPIFEPCHENWGDMTGDGAVRHCDSCDERVHDLSAMSQDEARAFLREHGREQPCVRYRFDGAGRLLFAAALLSVTASGCLMGKVAPEHEPPSEAQSATPCEGSKSVEPGAEQAKPEAEGQDGVAGEGSQPGASAEAPVAAVAGEDAVVADDPQ